MFFGVSLMAVIFRPASCFVRDCFALKWLNPGLRPRTFPVPVILSRFVYDLFVFELILVVLVFCLFR